eukprot:CAMPEP_0115112534 /NCGR_PEP_ID=MMETSP0227-20121206/40743_1 /TAXON_ID=89957 /ORGANISM="Polarella glacialis, Strain CCMP 1383" /LENGTH=129 /DNA_ID=CAMNT_0002512211 /DNA_START=323 /DNA_END=710 /DNA_ORIENTATION=+
MIRVVTSPQANLEAKRLRCQTREGEVLRTFALPDPDPDPDPVRLPQRPAPGPSADASRLARPKLPCRGHPFLPACHASTGTLRVASEGDEPVPARTSQGVPDTRSGSGTSRLRRRLRRRDGLWRAEPQA